MVWATLSYRTWAWHFQNIGDLEWGTKYWILTNHSFLLLYLLLKSEISKWDLLVHNLSTINLVIDWKWPSSISWRMAICWVTCSTWNILSIVGNVKCNINGWRVVYSTDSTELSSNSTYSDAVHGRVSNHPLDKLYLTLIVISIHNNRPVYIILSQYYKMYLHRFTPSGVSWLTYDYKYLVFHPIINLHSTC